MKITLSRVFDTVVDQDLHTPSAFYSTEGRKSAH